MKIQLRKVGCGCLAIAGSCLLLFVIAAATTYFVAQRRARMQVAEQLAELSADGIPITPEDLDVYYVVPESETNVTNLWLLALEPLVAAEFHTDAEGLPLVDTDQPIPPPGEAWEELDSVRSLLQEYSDSLRLLHEAADQGPTGRFDTAFENGLEMLLPHAQNLRVGARMLTLEAHVRAHDGDTAGAANSIQACFRLSRALEREPVIVSQLVRMACSGMALNQVTDLLPYVQFSDEELGVLQETIREGDYRDGMQRGLFGERVMGVLIFQSPSAAGIGEGLDHLPMNNEDFALYLETIESLIQVLDLPWWRARTEATAICDELVNRLRGFPNMLRYTRSGLLLPALDSAFDAATRIETHRDIVDVAIAVERYRRIQGKVPEQIDQLVPEYLPSVPLDSFNGDALRYHVNDDAVVIYSVGTNGIDDGGVADERMKPDVAVRLPRNP